MGCDSSKVEVQNSTSARRPDNQNVTPPKAKQDADDGDEPTVNENATDNAPEEQAPDSQNVEVNVDSGDSLPPPPEAAPEPQVAGETTGENE